MAIKILQELSKLSILIVHPDDRQRQELSKHMERLGCNVRTEWPFPQYLNTQTDLLFIAMMQDYPLLKKPVLLNNDGQKPTIIAIVDYENPTILQSAYDVGVHAIINAPFKPFGLLASLVVARMHWHQEIKHQNKIKKLENKIKNIHYVEKAIIILGESNKINRQEAYNYIRSQAMNKRIPTEDFAEQIVQAHKTLNISSE